MRIVPVMFVWLMTSFAAIGLTAETPQPNIIFILADDLGINDLGCYGRKDQQTPRLDQLAADGMRFTSAYCAQPICSPSRAAILSGLTPARLHLTTFLPGRGDAPSQRLLHPKIEMQLGLERVTLPEHLKAAGYVTACIGKWHLGGAGFGPKEQGFDVVYAGKANTPPGHSEGGKGEFDLTDKAIDFIRTNRDRPFFVYLPHNTPHIPLAAKAELIQKYRDSFNPVYAAVIHSMDDCVGRVLDALDELKLTDRTLVVFTSDNSGVHLPELKEDAPTHNTPFRAGKGYLYEGGLRIPLIVRFPGVVPLGRVCNLPVINTDWLPTILELCRVPFVVPPGGQEAKPGQTDGVSLIPLLKGGSLPPRPLMWHFPHYNNQGGRPAGAIRIGDWKLIEHYEDSRVELFDLANDLSEERDVAPTEPQRAAQLRQQLADWRQSIGAQANTLNNHFDPAWAKRLYHDIDPSRIKPDRTAAATSDKLRDWRRGMDEVVRGTKK